MGFINTSVLAGGGVLVGQAVFMEEAQPADLTIYGKRYLRSGSVETDTNLFDTSIFTAKTITTTLTSRTSQFGSSGIRAAAFGNGVFVIVGVSGKVSTSADGITWTAQTPPVGTDISDIAFGAGLFVIVSSSGALYTSTNGSSWTSRTSGFGSDDIQKVDFVNNGFVAQGTISSNIRVATSADGITWTLQAQVIASGQSSGVAFANSTYLLVSAAGTAYTSSDAITWTSNAGLPNSSGAAVASSDSTFIATSNTGQVASSADGETWTARTSGYGGVIAGAHYDGVFVISGGNERVWVSPYGETFTSINTGAGGAYRGIATGNDMIVIAGDGGILLSADFMQYAGSTVEHIENDEYQYVRIS